MKTGWTIDTWKAVAMSVAVLIGAGACDRETGMEAGFEYTAGWMSAELTEVDMNAWEAGQGAKEENGILRIEVPKKLGGKRVRSVGAGAFRRCTNAVSVKIPWQVSSIGAEAFAGCPELVWAELPSRLTRLEEGLFRGCTHMVESDIPKRVEEIGPSAYSGCTRLERVALPEKLRVVGAYAFSDCLSLKSLELPDRLCCIGDGAFAKCRSLESLELPLGVGNIPDGAFEGCSGLRSVRIPEGVTNIGARAFAGCVSLERIELPKGVRCIGDDAFSRCVLLETVAVPGSVERLGERAFAGCSGLKSVELPDHLSSMGRECFRETGLESVIVPPTLAVLEEGFFSGCTALAKVGLSPGLETVRADAFRMCPVTTLSLPATVQSVHPTAFSACPGLDTVEVEAGNPVFSVRDGVLFRDGGAELVLFPSTRGGRYAVPENVKRIGPYAFRGSMVEEVSVPDGVATIAESAFRDCRRLRRVAGGGGVKEIGDAAFAGCTALWEFVMPAGVERTGNALFAECETLLFLVLPDGLPGDVSPEEAWQVPGRCSILPRSAWKEAVNGKRLREVADPFYGLYTGEDLDTASFEGTVLASSAIPDPEKNDYDDCLYAILVELDSVVSATPLSTNVERVVLVNVPVMEERTIVRQNLFEPGDKISCTCASYDAMPPGILEIQLSDDIQSFEHQQYYPLGIDRIPAFRKTGNKDFAKREISILPIRTLPRDGDAASARRERIRTELARIESELARHGGSFEAWKEEYKSVAEKYGKLCEEGYAGWIGDSYFAAGGSETGYHTQAYIEGILPYKKYLDANNIDLIIVRVPSKWDFAARVLASDDFRENPAWVEHYYECLKNDIEIIDPMPEMWKERFDFPLFYFYQVPEERHLCEGAAFVVAKEIAGILERYPYQKTEPGIVLRDGIFETDWALFFWPGGNAKFDPSKNLVFKQALLDNEPLDRFVPCSGSPFLFLSNSHFWFPRRPLGASVPGYAAWFLQTVPDWRYQGGIGNPMVKYLLAPHLLDGRRAVVMVGGHDAWKGFPAIPKYIPDGARRIVLERTILAASDEMAIDVHDAFSHSLHEDGSVWFEADGGSGGQGAGCIDMGFSVPSVEGKQAGMLRVNIEKTSAIAVKLVEEGQGTVIDTVYLPPSRLHTADFFVPFLEPDAKVTVSIIPRSPEPGLFVKNVEIWYY